MTEQQLHVADDLDLPRDVVTQRIAIVGRTGSGKTSTGVVLAEEMIRAALPVVILDPLGVWHGLRSSPDGQSPGLPVVIFGGEHGDLPLPVGSGALIADVIVDQRPPAVIDLSGFDSDAEIRRWCAAFLKQLYRRNRDPLHVIVDEADLLAPQQGSGDAAHSLNAMKAVARRGRVKGLGLTLITQRPASLAKEVLNQAELLVAMQLTGPRDIAAIDEWMSQVGDQGTVGEVRRSLPSLTTGESWWWSPAWLELLARVQVRRRATFDSSATPKPGETRIEPTRLAPVDLAALGKQIAALQAEADTEAGKDPKRLRARIRDLERQLADRPAPTPVEPERVEVPVLTDDDRAALTAWTDGARTMAESLTETARAVLERVTEVEARLGTPAPSPNSPPPARAPRHPARARPEPVAGPSGLPRAQGAVLQVLASYERPLTPQQAALLAGYSPKSSGFSNALGALRAAGFVSPPREPLTATPAGRERAGEVPDGPTGRDLGEALAARLGKAPSALLAALLDVAPEPMTHEELALASGYSPTSSGFSNALGQLRSLGLATGGRAAITADSDLIDSGTR